MKDNFKQPVISSRAGLGLSMLLLTATFAQHASADSASAIANVYANMARAGLVFPMKQEDAVAQITPIRGIYGIYDRYGKLGAYTNEAGTIIGDSRSFEVLQFSAGGNKRPMTADEQKDLRAEIMANIDYSKLIKVVYGDGGGRKLMMFSALDCGYCQKLEATLEKHSRSMNTTLYVVPGTLQAIRQGGGPLMESVTRIWCDPNSGSAWRKYWSKGAVPNARQCVITPASAEAEVDHLQNIISGAGSRVLAVPSILDEDGNKLDVSYNMNVATANAEMGANGRRQASQPKPAVWVVSADEARAQMQAIAAQSPLQQQPQQQQAMQQNGKINTKDLLKKLFK